jgi:hypothetical protein
MTNGDRHTRPKRRSQRAKLVLEQIQTLPIWALSISFPDSQFNEIPHMARFDTTQGYRSLAVSGVKQFTRHFPDAGR